MRMKTEYGGLRTEYKPRKVVPVNIIVENFVVQRTDKGLPIIVPVLDESGIHFVAELAKERIQNKYDCVIMYTGSRGTGKSTLCQDVALCIDRKMPLDNIKWTYQDWKDGIRDSPMADPANGFYPQLVLDEAGFDLYSKEWMMTLQRDASKILQLIRVKGLILHLIMPHKDDLIKDIRDGMGYMWVNTDPRKEFGMERGYAEVRIGQINKFHRAEYWDPRACFWFPEQTGKFWEDYSTRKIAFVNEALARKMEPKLEETPLMAQRNSLIREMVRLGVSETRVGQIINKDHSQVSRIINNKTTS